MHFTQHKSSDSGKRIYSSVVSRPVPVPNDPLICAERPVSGVWQEGALLEEFKLGVGFKLGTGRPILEQWDPRCRGIKY